VFGWEKTCQGFPEGMPVAGEPGRVCEGMKNIEKLMSNVKCQMANVK